MIVSCWQHEIRARALNSVMGLLLRLVKKGGFASADSIIEDFLETIPKGTEVGYRKSWRYFRTWAHGRTFKFSDITPLQAETYAHFLAQKPGLNIRGLTNRKLSKTTIRKELAILKRLFDVIQTESKARELNPFERIFKKYSALTFKQIRPTEYIPKGGLALMLGKTPDSKRGVRDRAIIAMLFGGALRRAELTRLSIGHLKITSDGVYQAELYNTKNGDDKTQPLQVCINRYIEDLLIQRENEGATSEDPLFVDYRGDEQRAIPRRMSESCLYQRFKIYASLCKFPKTISPHSARATAITDLLESGLTHREVMEFSRHNCIESVVAYDKKRDELADRCVRKLSL